VEGEFISKKGFRDMREMSAMAAQDVIDQLMETRGHHFKYVAAV
jgi:hypothetical protein